MNTLNANKESMPDVTNAQTSKYHVALDWVGMGEVEVLLNHSENNKNFPLLPAKANIFVNLGDPKAKGIHMSRIYMLASQGFEENSLKISDIKSLLQAMVNSQEGKSNKAKINLRFELPVKRKALMSSLEGLRHYPIDITWEMSADGEVTQLLNVEVVYSSTCPCSAALARQLIKNKWKEDFQNSEKVSVEDVAVWLEKEESIIATPHAQRSLAHVKIKLGSDSDIEFLKYIDLLEQTLKTPVQTAVKREDEQEFARLNGTHLMFCEDAARKIYCALNTEKEIKDFWLKVEHLESLHSHNAVSETSKFGNKI